ncbi:hypothetical protein CT0861_09877 [Colletotrichum tofieldiae]|uniref:Uncharacterized protein n=1 Tax=Colletotrichum tofieldiae TaxID=708197 RepID=A0A161WHW4_9PEZI|nr:hypothetical protein CT0861_09877 [Colletotrichum tofieldiae]
MISVGTITISCLTCVGCGSCFCPSKHAKEPMSELQVSAVEQAPSEASQGEVETRKELISLAEVVARSERRGNGEGG